MTNSPYIYLYDGTFPNLLALIEYLFETKRKPINIKSETTYQENLIDQTISIHLKNNKKFYQYLEKKISKEGLKIAYYVYLSVEPEKELIIYYFLLNGLKYGPKIIYLRNLNCVSKALKVSQFVSHETHRMKGFLRFKEINGTFLYAEIAPDNNVLALISKHFKERLKNENWLIKDTKRNLISVYHNQKNVIMKSENIKFVDFNIEEQELEFQKLWMTFFQTIAIKERKNLRCQMNFMPKKYWKYIIEMSDSNETNYQG